MAWPTLFVLSCLALLSSGAAVAQTVEQDAPSAASPAATEAGDEIVVTGRKPLDPEKFARAVDAFVREGGKTGPIDQISR